MGLSLTLGKKNPSLWLEIIGKIKVKIVVWGGLWLTKDGKLILIKTILLALHNYQPSLLAPKSIMDQISKMLKDFLWRGGKKFRIVCIWLIGKM